MGLLRTTSPVTWLTIAKTEIMETGGRERCMKVCSFKAAFFTSNIYPNRNMAVVPLGCDDKMDHLIASLAGRELASGPSSPLLRGVDI